MWSFFVWALSKANSHGIGKSMDGHSFLKDLLPCREGESPHIL